MSIVDSRSEQVLTEDELGGTHVSAIGSTARLERREDSWLADSYRDWVFDRKNRIAYAIRSDRWIDGMDRMDTTLCALDIRRKALIRNLSIPQITALALCPDKPKLYVASMSVGTDEIGEGAPGLLVISTKTLRETKRISIVSDHAPGHIALSNAGSLMICSSPRGILFLDTKSDTPLVTKRDRKESNPKAFYYVYDDRSHAGLAISDDEREAYIGLRAGERRGAIAAIDIRTKQLARRLELSQTACTSVAVVKGKLFAACLDGVYVIDIDRWRESSRN